MKIRKLGPMLIAGILSISTMYGQERKISVDELFELAKENHPNLAVSKADIDIARQGVEVAKKNVEAYLNVSWEGGSQRKVDKIDKVEESENK